MCFDSLTYFQVKRRDHRQDDDNILGQEVATLLAAVTARAAGEGRRLRCEQAAPNDERIMTMRIFSWHHLEAHVSRADIPKNEFFNLTNDRNDFRGPLVVRRSRSYDMKDTSERLEFLKALVIIVFKQFMDRYRVLDDGMRALCGW